MQDFQNMLDMVYEEKSIFSCKLIVCRLTRDKKLTLAGSKFRETSPRYGDAGSENVQISDIGSMNQFREILATQFGIGSEETEMINWELVASQDPELFAHM
jgi:arylamine N-acetyltransferase